MNIIARSQNNPEWKGEILGDSKTTIGSHGCTVSCVAMLAGITPKEVNDRLKNGGGFAAPKEDPTQKNLILWTKIQACIPWLQFEYRYYSYTDADNARVADAIAKNGGCLVEVDGAPIGGVKHWVLYIGNKKLIDPWDGKTKATSTYKALGYAIINRVGEPPKPEESPVQVPANVYPDLVHGSTEWDKTSQEYLPGSDPKKSFFDDVKRVISGIKSRVTDLTGQLASAIAEKVNREEQVSRLKEQLTAEQNLATERYSALNEQLKIAQKAVSPLEGRITELQGQVDRTAKSLGEANIKASQLEAENKLLKDKVTSPLSLWDILVLLSGKLVPFLKNTRV